MNDDRYHHPAWGTDAQSIKERDEEITRLKERIGELEAEVNNQMSRVVDLEAERDRFKDELKMRDSITKPHD